jgi:glycosyltransferase involved in cell wall biosynthesis
MKRNQKKIHRLLVIISGMSTGGAETQLKVLLQNLPDDQFEIMLISLTGKDVVDLSKPLKLVQPKLANNQAVIVNLLRVFRLLCLVILYRPNTIQGWMYGGNIFAGLAKICAPKALLYLGIRASDMDEQRYKYQIFLNKLISKFATGVVYNSFAGLDYHISKGFNKSRAKVIHNGICSTRFKPDQNSRKYLLRNFGVANGRPVVIYPARVDPMKNHQLVIQIASRLPEVQFVFVGSGVENLRTPSNCLLVGKVSNPESYYNMADLTVSFSKYGEGFSNTIAESLSCGVPVLANSVGDSAIILSGVGFVTESKEPKYLANRIKSLLSDKRKLKRSSIKGRELVADRFDVKSMVDCYVNLYNQK